MTNRYNGTVQVAVIGGSAFYKMDGLSDIEEVNIDTPFGSPSDSIIVGNIVVSLVVTVLLIL